MTTQLSDPFHNWINILHMYYCWKCVGLMLLSGAEWIGVDYRPGHLLYPVIASAY